MPVEDNRTTKRKRITLPGGAGFVDVPVITSIKFKDPVRRGQEAVWSIDNSGLSDRDVHVVSIPTTGAETISVERIDVWRVKDPVRRGQETHISMDNVTGEEDKHFSTHLKTHVVRYKNPSDSNAWIESELIDEFIVKDPVRRGQETHYTLNNPKNDADAQADPNDEDISDSDNGVDPPIRTDPFQNIINWSGNPYKTFTFRTNFFGRNPVPPPGSYVGFGDSNSTPMPVDAYYVPGMVHANEQVDVSGPGDTGIAGVPSGRLLTPIYPALIFGVLVGPPFPGGVIGILVEWLEGVVGGPPIHDFNGVCHGQIRTNEVSEVDYYDGQQWEHDQGIEKPIIRPVIPGINKIVASTTVDFSGVTYTTELGQWTRESMSLSRPNYYTCSVSMIFKRPTSP